MGEALRESNPALAEKVGVDEVEPPMPEASPDPKDHEPEPEGAKPDDGAQSEGAAKPDETGNPTEAELAAEQERQQTEAAAEKAKADETLAAQKAKDEAEAAAKKTAPAKTPEQDARDADLKDQLSPHTHPKTRKVIEAKNAKIQEARNERDRLAKESAELKTKYDEAVEKSKGTTLPKETEDELKTLRERVRELDITRDPQMEAKYDRPTAANNKLAVDLLKGFDADKMPDPSDATKLVVNPNFETQLLNGGLSLRKLQPFIQKLDEKGFADEAEQLREVVRENTRLAKAKTAEVESWKADYDTRKQARVQQGQQQTEAEVKALQTETDTTLKAELTELSKTLPFLNPPPAPLATDADAVRKAKQAALDEYNSAAKQVSDMVAAFNSSGKTPEQARAASAKFSASAILGVVARQHAIPRLLKDAAAKDARIKDLETQLGKLRGANTLSRQHASLASAPQGGAAEIPAGAATGDALAAYAKAAGVNINS